MATASSFRQILGSTILVGGASAVRVVIGLVRTKALAVLLGSEGLGLVATYEAVSATFSSAAGMGVASSGVRQIADASGKGDVEKLARVAHTIRRVSLVLGTVGSLTLFATADVVSSAAFGDVTHAEVLAYLSVSILFTTVAGAHSALLQGMRRIRALSTVTVSQALVGTAVGIPLVVLLRDAGIAPFLVALSAVSAAVSWRYSRQLGLTPVKMSLPELGSEARALLTLGFVFMMSGFVLSVGAFAIRALIVRELNLEAVGLYQAAFTLSVVYVGFVLSAMGADYYPRLTSVAGDRTAVNRLVNEQIEVGILIALPGLLVMLTAAPWLLQTLYSAEFGPAVDVLRWHLLGAMGRVCTWPLSYVLLAQGRGRTFLLTESASTAFHLAATWVGMRSFGLAGLGIAFVALYLFYGVLTVTIVHKLTGFVWTQSNVRLGVSALLVTGGVFVLTGSDLPGAWGVLLATAATIVASIVVLLCLKRRAGYGTIIESWRGLRRRFAGRRRQS